MSAMKNLLIEELETSSVTSDNGDHERFSHYVEKEEATRALIEGTPVVALCGKIWVPSRDPDKYPVCPTCLDIFKSLFGVRD
jgi:hypothetical protein